MRLVNTNDPKERAKAARHYERMARQAVRQRNWNERRYWLLHQRHFTFVDMILVAIASAVLAMGFTALYMR